jgi:hypothetical protein
MTNATIPMCAVVGCIEPGKHHTCPYDGSRHHHGRIHYENNHFAHPEIVFRDGPWMLICDRHYKQICNRLEEYRAARNS